MVPVEVSNLRAGLPGREKAYYFRGSIILV